jgi:hypothetical protein
VNRNKHENLDRYDIFKIIDHLPSLRTVEWTGGGDPTQYDYIREVIAYAHMKGLRQGFITNGIDLVESLSYDVHLLDWVRVSLNSLDYVDDIRLPAFNKGILGFSYVMNDLTHLHLDKIKEFVKKHNPKYVRIVPNCQTSYAELKGRNDYFSELVGNWGSPYFYQAKSFSKPSRCWWGHFKPFLLHDGFIYPCSSVVLNDTAERSFHSKFRWKTISEFIESSNNVAVPYDCKNCTHCVFGEQNNLVEALIDDEMEDFI